MVCLIRNQQAEGSIPPAGSNKIKGFSKQAEPLDASKGQIYYPNTTFFDDREGRFGKVGLWHLADTEEDTPVSAAYFFPSRFS